MSLYYPGNDVHGYLTIINAYLYGLIDYQEYRLQTKNFIAYHHMSDRQLLQAYAQANAFFLEPTQIDHWFQSVLRNKSAKDYEKWKTLYEQFKSDCPNNQLVEAMEQTID